MDEGGEEVQQSGLREISPRLSIALPAVHIQAHKCMIYAISNLAKQTKARDQDLLAKRVVHRLCSGLF